jgi:pimeloyl-ACP methyl ester carboxylesterase
MSRRTSALRQAGSVLGLAVGVSILTAAALVAAAALTGSAWWSAAVAALTALALAVAVATLARRRQLRRDGPQAAPTGGGSLLGRPLAGPVVLISVTCLLSMAWLWPGPGAVTPEPVPGTVLVPAPGGVMLAVHVTPARTATEPPLVVVHGGPGVADMAHDVPAFAALAEHRDVVVYDQVGAGASTRLGDPAGYTLGRAVRDLEAVRSFTGAARVAILGHSWGALVAAGYASQHPERVAALVFSAPNALPEADGAIPAGDLTKRLDVGARARLYLRLASPRNLLTYGLTAVDPQVAHALAGDAEMDRRFAAIYGQTAPALFCDPGLTGRLGREGVGYYANQIPQLYPDDATAAIDRSRLSTLRAPALVVKPACDYLPWAAATGYLAAVPGARLVLLPDAGHQAYLERPDAYAGLVRAFLGGCELPLPVHDGQQIPDGYRGVR